MPQTGIVADGLTQVVCQRRTSLTALGNARSGTWHVQLLFKVGIDPIMGLLWQALDFQKVGLCGYDTERRGHKNPVDRVEDALPSCSLVNLDIRKARCRVLPALPVFGIAIRQGAFCDILPEMSVPARAVIMHTQKVPDAGPAFRVRLIEVFDHFAADNRQSFAV